MFPTSVLRSSLGGRFQKEQKEEEVGGEQCDHGGRHPAAECRPGRRHAARPDTDHRCRYGRLIIQTKFKLNFNLTNAE